MWRTLVTYAAAGMMSLVGLGGICAGGGGTEPETPEEQGETTGDALESQGDSCQRDPDCSSYLRCIDRTCSIPPAVEGDVSESTPRAVFETDAADGGSTTVAFHLELATTSPQRQRGLMYRREMADGWGMLFVYPGEAERSFWMKNTYISLDMIFIDAAGEVVSIYHGAEPMTEKLHDSEGPARYVLEVEAGEADEHGVDAGDVMRLENVASRNAPSR